MKTKSIVIFLFLFLVLFSCNRKKENLYYPNGKLKKYYETKNGMVDGVLIEYYQNGSIKSKSNWKNDILHGLSIHYYKNGKIKEKNFYIDGLINGKSLEYYKNGSLKKNLSKINDTIIGVANFFHKNGMLKEKRIHDEKGNLIYIAGFNEGGDKYVESVMPVINSKNDTIKLNKKYNFSIEFKLPLSGKMEIMVVELSENNNTIIDTLDILKSNNYKFSYSIKADKRGLNQIPLFFNHSPDKGDSLSANGLLLKHTYFVKK